VNWLPRLGVALAAAIWGGAFVALKVLLAPAGPLDPWELAWCRYAPSALVFLILALCLVPREFLGLARLRPGLALITGLLGVAAYNVSLHLAESRLPASLTLLIVAANPVLTLALSGEPFTARRILGSALALAGLAAVLLCAPHAGNGGWGPDPLWGLLAAVAAGFCWSGYSLLSGRLSKEAGPLAVTALTTVLGTLPLLVMAPRSAALVERISSAGSMAWAWVAYLVLLSTLAAFLLYAWGIKRLGAASASLWLYLMPAFGLLWGRNVLDEKVNGAQLAGAAVLIAGVALATRRKAG